MIMGVPEMTWRETHGCVRDLSFWVTFNFEEITIQSAIPHKEITCHPTAALSISLSLWTVDWLERKGRRLNNKTKESRILRNFKVAQKFSTLEILCGGGLGPHKSPLFCFVYFAFSNNGDNFIVCCLLAKHQKQVAWDTRTPLLTTQFLSKLNAQIKVF